MLSIASHIMTIIKGESMKQFISHKNDNELKQNVICIEMRSARDNYLINMFNETLILIQPFSKEGKNNLTEVNLKSDSIIVVQKKKFKIKKKSKMLHDILAQAISGVVNIILTTGDKDINLDFFDLKTLMHNKYITLMGTGEYKGDTTAYTAMKMAIESPLLDYMSIDNTSNILIHFSIHPNFSLLKLAESMEVLHDITDENTKIVWGTSTNISLSEEYIKIIIIATIDL